MRILLFDADLPTRVTTRKRRKTPNLALMKLSAWHKARGDQVELNFLLGEYDLIYASCVFPKNRPRIEALPFDAVIAGGSGWDLYTELGPEIEHIMPDYSLYGCNFSMGFTSRGCIRRCPWCVVPEKEGWIQPWAWIYEFWDRRHTKIKLLDNNLLASPTCIGVLMQLASEQVEVDFNQGLDIRLIDDEKAWYLSKVRLTRWLRFSFDEPGMEKQVRQGIEMLNRRGISPQRLSFYMLIGFDTSYGEDMGRLKLLESYGCDVFAMRYQEVNDVKARVSWDGPGDLAEFARWINVKECHRNFTYERWVEVRKAHKNRGRYAPSPVS